MTAPPRAAPFWIEDNAFDTGLLAPKVGVLHMDDAPGASVSDGRCITDEARRAGYNLLMFQSPHAIEMEGFTHVGTTEEYAATVGDLSRQLVQTTTHFVIEAISPARWAIVETLLPYAAPTRFSRDPRLSADTVKRHKLANVRARTAGSTEYTAIAFSSSLEPLGFQCSYLRDGVFVLYELIVRPHALRGIVAAELLSRNVQAFRLRHPDIEPVTAVVYADNVEATSFFVRLGMNPTGRRSFWYHAWL